MRRWGSGAIACALVACGPQVDIDGTGDTVEASGSDTGAGAVSGSPPMTTSPPTPPPPSTSTSTTGPPDPDDGTETTDADDGVSFIAECDLAGAPPGTKAHCSSVPDPCDPWAQDCPRGEKCVPFADDGGPAWNSTICVPVDPNPAGLGESCTAQGSATSGFDDCDFGMMCWVDDTEALTGVCIAQCTGSERAPVCQPGTGCAISNFGSITVCLDECHPLGPGCDTGICTVIGSVGFLCTPSSEPGTAGPGDGCPTGSECGHGSQCSPAAQIPGCVDATCCTSYCDLGAPDPSASCLAGQGCTALYPPGTAPEGFGDLGICTA